MFINIIRNHNITTPSKILNFKKYMKNKKHHLIPLLVLAGKIKNLLEVLRKSIFKKVLEYNRMSLKSLFGLDYYTIIIKPIYKMIKKIQDYYSKYTDTLTTVMNIL